jgi:hypothetical protein
VSKVNESTYQKLLELARSRFNVLLTGTHGVGKTTLCKRIQEDLGIGRVKYYSASTLDPWVDVVGVPRPSPDDPETLLFSRPKDLLQAEWVIFDEINRSHSKVQNAVLEMVQFRSVNGVPLQNLRMVWGMQNPPTPQYQVNELDPALTDRFHARITLTASPSATYYQAVCGIPADTATALVEWWTRDLNEDQHHLVTPRTLEAIGKLMAAGIDWRFALGDSLGVPLSALDNRIAGCAGLTKYEKLDLPTMIYTGLDQYVELAKEDPDFAVHLSRICAKAQSKTMYKAAKLVLALPGEFLNRLLADNAWTFRMKQVPIPADGDVDALALYNKVKAVSSY